jgi:hypothetical protein
LPTNIALYYYCATKRLTEWVVLGGRGRNTLLASCEKESYLSGMVSILWLEITEGNGIDPWVKQIGSGKVRQV